MVREGLSRKLLLAFAGLSLSSSALAQSDAICPIDTNVTLTKTGGWQIANTPEDFEAVKGTYLKKIDGHFKQEQFDEAIDCVLALNTLNANHRLATPGPPSNDAIQAALFAIDSARLPAARKIEVYAKLYQSLDAEFARSPTLVPVRDQSLVQFHQITLELSQALIERQQYPDAGRVLTNAANRVLNNGRMGAEAQVKLLTVWLYLVDRRETEVLGEGASADPIFSEVVPIVEGLLNDTKHSPGTRLEAIAPVVNTAFELVRHGSVRGTMLLDIVPDGVRTARPHQYIGRAEFGRYHTLRMFEQLKHEGAVLSQSAWASEVRALRNSVQAGTLAPRRYVNRQTQIIDDLVRLTPREGTFASDQAALNIAANLRVWIQSQELSQFIREIADIRMLAAEARIERKRGNAAVERKAIERVIGALNQASRSDWSAAIYNYASVLSRQMSARLNELPAT